MSLNQTVSAERIHIAFFGRRNAGKSSLVNAVTNQQLSVVSEVLGTTTDPVRKAMELLPLGPVVIIDTPGFDDEGELGALRVKKTREILRKTHIAVLVVDITLGLNDMDREYIALFEEHKIPYIVAYNKCDIGDSERTLMPNEACVSATEGKGINSLKLMLGEFAKELSVKKPLVSDLISKGDRVVLVTPIDESAPKGRLILPQQMVLRDILDSHAAASVCQVEELEGLLLSFKEKPCLVITDSQAFAQVSKIVPRDIKLTSFSILMARYKGELSQLMRGAEKLRSLSDSDKVLIAEGCTHHRQCNDIGTVKMPNWIREYCGAKPQFEFTSGGEFPVDLSEYKVIVHCGGCMLPDTEMKHRTEAAKAQSVPMVNYGIAIAAMTGILDRSTEVFAELSNPDE